jgi:hypothetical protein
MIFVDKSLTMQKYDILTDSGHHGCSLTGLFSTASVKVLQVFHISFGMRRFIKK